MIVDAPIAESALLNLGSPTLSYLIVIAPKSSPSRPAVCLVNYSEGARRSHCSDDSRMLLDLAEHNGHAPWLLQLRSSTGFIIATVWMSSFTVCTRYPPIYHIVTMILTTLGLFSLCSCTLQLIHLTRLTSQIVPVMPSALVDRAHVPYEDRMSTTLSLANAHTRR